MMRLLCDGVVLDLYDNAGLQFTHKNPLFAFDKLECERTTSLKLPCTAKNDKVLKLARIPAYDGIGMRRKFTAQLQSGSIVKDGYLYVDAFDGKDYNAIFVTGEFVGLQAIKNLGKLKDIITFSEVATLGGSAVSPSAAVGNIWENVNYKRDAGVALSPSIELDGLYNAICEKYGIEAPALPTGAAGVRIVPAKVQGADNDMQFKCVIIDQQGQPTTPEPTDDYNELTYDSTLFTEEVTDYRVRILSVYQYFHAMQFKAKTNLKISFPDDFPNTIYLYDLSEEHDDPTSGHFYGDRCFTSDSSTQSETHITRYGQPWAGREVEINAGDCFTFVDERYYANFRTPNIGGGYLYTSGFMLGDQPTMAVDFLLHVKTEPESGDLARLQDNLPDITFTELLKTIAALSGRVLNYLGEGIINYMQGDWLPLTRIYNATFDRASGTITSTRTNNTNPNSNNFRIYKCNGTTRLGTYIAIKGDTGIGYVSFTTDFGTWNALEIMFNGNAQDTKVYFDITKLKNNTEYTLWYNISTIDRTYTGNDGQVTHIVLVEGSNAVTWNRWRDNRKGIVFEELDVNMCGVSEITDLTKRGEVKRVFADYKQNNYVQFDDEKADKIITDYTIDNVNLELENNLQTIPFSEGANDGGMLYVYAEGEKPFMGGNDGVSTYLTRVSLPKNAGLQNLCDMSTQFKIEVRMNLLQYTNINEKTVLLIDGIKYLWTERSWQGDVAKFTLAKCIVTNQYYGLIEATKQTIVNDYGVAVWDDLLVYVRNKPQIAPYVNNDPHLACSLVNTGYKRWLYAPYGQYITTDIPYTTDIELDVTFKIDTIVAYSRIIGLYSSNYYVMYINASGMLLILGNGVWTLQNGKTYRVTLQYGTYNVFEDGVLVKDGTITIPNYSGTTMRLYYGTSGGYFYYGSLGNKNYIRCSSVERTLVPYAQSTSSKGMLDLNTLTYYPNEGSGQFTINETAI